eukprot:EG_transcript_12676
MSMAVTGKASTAVGPRLGFPRPAFNGRLQPVAGGGSRGQWDSAASAQPARASLPTIRHGFIYISTLMIFLVWRSIRRVQMANKQCSILAVDGVEAGPKTTVVDDAASLQECIPRLRGERLLAMDVEGVGLNRFGRVALVQLGLRSGECFIFDVLNQSASSEIVQFLKTILEDESVTKIVHDCRTDSDALYHRLGVRLAAVHDTQAWAEEPMNLNATLNKYNCPLNRVRDKFIYEDKPAFWAQRPMNEMMVDWATRDIHSLFQLYDRQAFGPYGMDILRHREMKDVCDARLAALRDAVAQQFTVLPGMAGRFVGKGGANLRRLEARTGVRFGNSFGNGRFIAYARDKAALEDALLEISDFLA